MTGLAAALVLGGALSSCMSATLTSSFNPADAAIINQKGKGSVSGQAFLRRNDGIVVYAAGSEVAITPKTAYSSERVAAIYKGAKIAYFGTTFKNDDPEYYKYARKTVADGEGRFAFEGLADGTYYITTTVIWMVQYAQQGGALIQEVTVADGKAVNVIMSGQ